MYGIHYTIGALLLFIITLILTAQFQSNYDSITPITPEFPPHSDRPKPRLHLKEDSSFRISIINDLHYGEKAATIGSKNDRKSTEVIAKVLDFERPDFTVINGDLITGDYTLKENSTKYVDQIVSPLVEKNYKWASTYGNHDTQYNLSRERLFLEDSKYDLSYTKHSPPGIGGVSNYYLPIYPFTANSTNFDESIAPIAILWFFDSQGGENYQRWGFRKWMPNWVEASAVSWFRTERDRLEKQYGVLPSIAFVHIPPTPFLQLQKKVFPKKGGKDGRFPGLNDDAPVANQGEGRWGQKDLGFVQALAETKGLHSVYSGHDHGNSWCGTWNGEKAQQIDQPQPFLCFCKHTGYGGYGEWRRGSRTVDMKFGGTAGKSIEVESWVRMENGELIQKIGLNETYGIDVYPEDDSEVSKLH